MKLKILKQDFSICKLETWDQVDFTSEFCFVEKTDEELSLVCITECVPDKTIEREDGWKAFRIEGILDFSLIGILSKISSILAENRIGIFVISTYNTDYILVKQENLYKAKKKLKEQGYEIEENK